MRRVRRTPRPCRASWKNSSSGSALVQAGDVRGDRRQHVVAREHRARRSGRTGRGGRRCGPGVCTAIHSRRAQPDGLGVGEADARLRGAHRASGSDRRSPLNARVASASTAMWMALATPRLATDWAPRSAGGRLGVDVAAGLGSESHQVRNQRWVTMSAPLSRRRKPAPPKWSGWLCVTTTVCTRFEGMPAAASRSLERASSWLGPISPGRRGRSHARPRARSSSRGRGP